jgi:hypothetical protein
MPKGKAGDSTHSLQGERAVLERESFLHRTLLSLGIGGAEAQKAQEQWQVLCPKNTTCQKPGCDPKIECSAATLGECG